MQSEKRKNKATWNITLTVMLELGIQVDEDVEYIVLLELIPD